MAQIGSGPVTVEDAEGQLAISDTQLASELFDYLRHYNPPIPEGTRDMLLGRYRVEISSLLPDLDKLTARAYSATDTVEPIRPIFALVCDPGSYQRSRIIGLLTGANIPYSLPLIASGIVHLSQPDEERFVIIYERPAGEKLSEFLARNQGTLDSGFLCARIIAPLAQALNEYATLGISHGTVNADNIYFKDFAVLGPCVTGPCGHAQPFYYEPLERMQALPAGRGEGTTEHDFYSLAVLMLHTLQGVAHFSRYTPDTLARHILREGVYNVMLRMEDIPENFFDFFRGLLCQNARDRWKYKEVKQWLDGKRFNVLTPPSPTEAVRPFEFAGAQINTRRELAHAFATHWEKVPEHVQGGKLNHWAAISLRNKELSENIGRIARTLTDTHNKSELQIGEQVMRLVLLLDPDGPIRFCQVSFNIDGIESLCTDLYVSKSQKELQILLKFLEFNMASYWLELQRRDPNYVISASLNALVLKLDRLRTYIRNNGHGFGMERMLYDLNPDMPCLSPYFARWHINTMPGLLRRLDRLAPQMAKDSEPIDRHISAIIASKLALQHEIKLHDLSAMPALTTHRSFIALYLLAQAQQKSIKMDLPGLTHWLALRTLPMLETIRSNTLRKKIKSMLSSRAQAGSLQGLAELVLYSDYASADIGGYQKAWRLYQANAAKIQAHRNPRLIEQQGNQLGYKIAKFFAYGALLVTLFNAFGGGRL